MKAAVFPQHTAHTIVAALRKGKNVQHGSVHKAIKWKKETGEEKAEWKILFHVKSFSLFLLRSAECGLFLGRSGMAQHGRYAWSSRRSIKAVRVGWMETFAAPFSLFLSRLRTERGEQQQKEEKPPLGLG